MSLNIGSGNGLVPDGTKPFIEPMVTRVKEISSDFNFRNIFHIETISCLLALGGHRQLFTGPLVVLFTASVHCCPWQGTIPGGSYWYS